MRVFISSNYFMFSKQFLLFQNGLNALHLSCKEGNKDVVSYAIKKGADIHALTKVFSLIFALVMFFMLFFEFLFILIKKFHTVQ